MKILHLTKKYPNALGGDSIVVSNLEYQQKQEGHDVFIITSNCSEIVSKENIFKFGLAETVPNLDKITFRRIISLFMLLFVSFRYLSKFKPDIIHSHSSDLGFFISITARLYGIPVVNTCHGVSFYDDQYSFFKRFMEKFFLRYGNFKRIITVDKSSVKQFKEHGINNVIYIPNGVDTKSITLEKPLKIKNQTLILLFVGRLETQKGIKYLIEAADILKENINEFEIWLVGDGSKKDELEVTIRERELSSLFKFLGKLYEKELLKVYKTADIFILPSIWEGFPLTLLEAWAAELPVISTDVGGITSICTDGYNALIIPPKNPKAISEAVIKLFKDVNLRTKIRKNGRELVEEKYSWEIVSKTIFKTYSEFAK
jgi:glycosyltransferase involved in cell wall biosynthesis